MQNFQQLKKEIQKQREKCEKEAKKAREKQEKLSKSEKHPKAKAMEEKMEHRRRAMEMRGQEMEERWKHKEQSRQEKSGYSQRKTSRKEEKGYEAQQQSNKKQQSVKEKKTQQDYREWKYGPETGESMEISSSPAESSSNARPRGERSKVIIDNEVYEPTNIQLDPEQVEIVRQQYLGNNTEVWVPISVGFIALINGFGCWVFRRTGC